MDTSIYCEIFVVYEDIISITIVMWNLTYETLLYRCTLGVPTEGFFQCHFGCYLPLPRTVVTEECRARRSRFPFSGRFRIFPRTLGRYRSMSLCMVDQDFPTDSWTIGWPCWPEKTKQLGSKNRVLASYIQRRTTMIRKVEQK